MRSFTLISMFMALALAACGKNEQPPPKSKGVTTGQESGPAGGGNAAQPMAAADPMAAARAMYAQTCAMCHGPDGTGQTPMAANLNPPPRNYTDAAWQESITDEQIKQVILAGKGGMPPHEGLLKDKPEVLDGLVKIVRGFKK